MQSNYELHFKIGKISFCLALLLVLNKVSVLKGPQLLSNKLIYLCLNSVKQMDLAQCFACDFQIHKKAYLQTIKIFTHTPKHPHDRHSY